MNKKKKKINLAELSNVVECFDQVFEYRYNQSGVIGMYLKNDLANIVKMLGGCLSVHKEKSANYGLYSQDNTVLIGTYDFFLNVNEIPARVAQMGWNLILITSTDRQYEEMSMYKDKLLGLVTENQVKENPCILVNMIVSNSEVA